MVRGRGLLARLLVAASTGPLLLFLFSRLGDWIFFAEMAVNFRLQLFWLLLAGTILLWLLGRRWIMATSGVALLWCAWPLVLDWIPAPQPPPGPQTVRLLTFNVLASNRHFDEVRELIRGESPDIVVIIELGNAWQAAMKQLAAEYPHQVERPRWHGYGLGVYSRLPVRDSRIVQLTEELTDNPAIEARIEAGGRELRLIAVHPTSPGQQGRLQLRNFQLSELAGMAAGPGPTVVCGDMNCTPWSRQFRRFLARTGLRDSRRGFGYQGSFPAWGWLIRIPIDHVLVSPDIRVHQRRTLPATGSDHLPVLCEFSITPEPSGNNGRGQSAPARGLCLTGD